jgi:hypothetical protein
MQDPHEEIAALLSELEGVFLTPEGALVTDESAVGGREKYARRRKIKRLSRLLERTELAGALDRESQRGLPADPPVDVTERDGEATVTVGAPVMAAAVEGEHLRLRTPSGGLSVELSFAPTAVEWTVTNGVSTVELG